MALSRVKILVINGAIVFAILMYLYLSSSNTGRPLFSVKINYNLSSEPRNESVYLVETSGCKIPKLNPFHSSVKHLLRRLPDLNCGSTNLLKVENATITINYPNSNNLTCFVQSITRQSEDKSVLSKKTRIVNGSINVLSEFVQVECTKNNSTNVFYRQFYPFVVHKPKVDRRIKDYLQRRSSRGDETFRIMLLGLDSGSKNQFLRHMLKTYEFIRNNLTYVELFGYNKVGKNTYSNIVPMLTGKMETEVNDTSTVHCNALPFIWKDYMKYGYRTMFSEDYPDGSICNYGRKGFSTQPVDYYLRPWSVVAEPYFQLYKTGCLNDKIEADVILKWMEDFFDFYPTDPLFAFTFLTRMSHTYINRLAYHDKPVRDFLERLYRKGHLNNTIVFFFGDHGLRFGNIRYTYVGRMEGRLPFMFLLLPSWFPEKYPQIYKNLKVNERRLTTPLDIYATLKDLLYFTKKLNRFLGEARGISLLRTRVSRNRTCADANIKSQWCACLNLEPISLNDSHVIKSAKNIVKKINSITAVNRTQCAEVSLLKVLNASKHVVELGEDSPHDGYTNYLLNILVLPSYGMFEGSVWFNGKNSYTVDDTIERIDMYGSQSSCIDVSFLKPYCYCVAFDHG